MISQMWKTMQYIVYTTMLYNNIVKTGDFNDITRIPRKASLHLLGQKSEEPQSERGY